MAVANLSGVGLPPIAVAAGATTPDPGGTAAAGTLGWSSVLGAAVQWDGIAWRAMTTGGLQVLPQTTTVEVNLSTTGRRSGKFTIAGSGLAIGTNIVITQAAGPYTGKGTLADEAEMDTVSVRGVVTDASTITCYWTSRTRVRGNFKFTYFFGGAQNPRGIQAFVAGAPGSSEVVGGEIAPYALNASAAASSAKAGTAATASTVITIKKDGATMGTITFGAGSSTGTISISSPSITQGQLVTFEAPATADATLANLFIFLGGV